MFVRACYVLKLLSCGNYIYMANKINYVIINHGFVYVSKILKKI